MTQIITCLELAAICLLPDYQPPAPKTVFDYPAVMSIYDPKLGGINCDDDCTTVAIGPLLAEYWNRAGACHPDLLGATVYFPAIDLSMKCVDTGGLIDVAWSEYYQRTVLYFDVLWDASAPPEWTFWLLEDWRITWTKKE